jgi:hypothetical protein
VKIDPKVLIPKPATNEMQLGMSQDEIRKRCGEPFEHSGPDEFYITPMYLIEVQFRGSNYYHASFIGYTRLRDPQKFAEDPSREALKTQAQPLDDTSVKEILAQQARSGKLT